MKIEGGTYAIASFELEKAEDYEKAWNYLFASWLPTSGFQPDDKLPFEQYMNDPKEHPENKQLVDIYIPVKAI